MCKPFAYMVQGEGSRLGAFDLGQIKAHRSHGLSLQAVADELQKSTGRSFSKEAVRLALRRLEDEPDWTGERRTGSGRPRATTAAVDRRIAKALTGGRGTVKTTSGRLRRDLPAARQVSKSTVCRRLQEAGLAWLRRRRKTLVSADLKALTLAMHVEFVFVSRQARFNVQRVRPSRPYRIGF